MGEGKTTGARCEGRYSMLDMGMGWEELEGQGR